MTRKPTIRISTRGKRPYKIVLTKTKDDDWKVELQGPDALTTGLMYGSLELGKGISKRAIKGLDEICDKVKLLLNQSKALPEKKNDTRETRGQI